MTEEKINHYRELFEERAAIIEFDAGYSRKGAEERALQEITNKMILDEDLNMKSPQAYQIIMKFKRELKK